MDSEEFATQLVRKYREAGRQLGQAHFPEDRMIEGERLLMLCETHMWAELFFGAMPPVKQLELLRQNGGYLDNMALTCRLADQIRDEVKHAKVFSRRLEELGGNPDITESNPTPEQVAMFEMMVEPDEIHEVAALCQMSTETMLSQVFTVYLENEIADKRTLEVIRQAEVDEGNHINNGKQIITEFADTPEKMRQVEELTERGAEAMYAIYGREYEPAERIVAAD